MRSLNDVVASGRTEPARPHVVIVDDEAMIRDVVEQYLTREGYRVSGVESGDALLRLMAEDEIDLIILDLLMPGEDGLSLTRRLRERSDVPIIILTGKGETVDRVVGLEMGADDYMGKPFELRELLARVRSVMRRHAGRDKPAEGADGRTVLRFAGWRLDLSARRLTSAEGAETPLTTGEFDLLAVFAANSNRVMSRNALLEQVRAHDGGNVGRSIDMQVGRLRRKIEADAERPALIKTVRGIGYLFTPAVERG